ncbi:MAG: porphobilinogen synthase [Pseudomonadota bacterium]|nr:porphobilinogen synthase [Pseudomonadota bacterium]
MIARVFPKTRMRRLRKHSWLRELTQEHTLHAKDLILPLFIHESPVTEPISSLPGTFRYGLTDLLKICQDAAQLGIPAVALFPVVNDDKKDPSGSEAFNPDNIICQAVCAINALNLDLGIICDCALDPYTNHSHDGVLQADGDVDNDSTIALLAKQAILLAQAGCHVIAPSDMQDGRVGYIRSALDQNHFHEVSILSYTAKYASHLYAPFRDAVGAHGIKNSAHPGQKLDKKTYQMNPANRQEALHIARSHLSEGADCLMVKPATSYLDVLYHIQQDTKAPVFAYQVSGEYHMLKTFSSHMHIDFLDILYENLIACKRAGASAILTYGAIEMARALQTTHG